MSRRTLLAAALAVTTVAGACAPEGHGDEPAGPAPRSSAGQVGPDRGAGAATPQRDVDRAALDALVRRYGRALASGQGIDALVPGDAASLRARTRTRSEGVRAVGVQRLELVVDPATVQVRGDRARLVAVGHALVRGTASPGLPLAVDLEARRTSTGWLLADDRGPGTLPQPWDLPGVRRVDRPGVVVLGNAAGDRIEWYADAAARARRSVEGSWPRHPPGAALVVLPATTAQAAVQLRRDPGSLRGLAALTVGSLRAGRTAEGDRIVVNPAGWDRLTPEGRETILRHELVHVLVRGTTTGPVPQWLSEGYATQASWADGAVPAQLRARARRWTDHDLTPSAAPSDDSLEQGDLTHAYDVSALLVHDLVQRHGRDRVVAFYEALASGASPDAAARDALGEGFEVVLARWRERLRAVARG